MPTIINGEKYYRTAEVCQKAGISRSTLFRWLSDGSFEDVQMIDRRGWRLFTEDDLARLKAEAGKTSPNVVRAIRKQRTN